MARVFNILLSVLIKINPLKIIALHQYQKGYRMEKARIIRNKIYDLFC